MNTTLARLMGANRPKVIAIFGGTREEVECAVSHARDGCTGLPVWAYCAERSEPVSGCDHFACGAGLSRFRKDLGTVWVALSIVAWTGHHGASAFKLLPFTCPPFRILIMNEAGGFFAPLPADLVRHFSRRLGDAVVSGLRRSGHGLGGALQWTGSLLFRAGEGSLDLAGLAWSLVYRGSQRVADSVRFAWSLAYRGGESLFDIVHLAWALLYQLYLRAGEQFCGAILLCRELLLSGLALLAKLVPELSLRAIRTRAHRTSAARDLRPAQDGSFVEVAITGRGWDRKRIIRAVHNSRASFVVFRWTGESASAHPLIAAALAENAFAVALQMAHSAWRERVVAKHPFRRLQPGEVSEVLAPFSLLLVVRRDALLEFGCPRAFTYGSALMTLFWKSSAAGMKSLVLGHDGPVTDEPAMDLEDAELAARVTVSPDLKKLGPANPHRVRGNLAWSPGHCTPFQGKPRVLVVSPYLPFPLCHGGAVRIYNLCREMAGEIDFILACFREENETVHYKELHQVFREVYVVDVDEKRADPSVPAQVADYRNAAMGDLIRRFCLSHSVDLVQLEYTQMAEYRDDTGAIPVLLVEHDITFTLHRQLAELGSGLNDSVGLPREYQRWLSFERQALQCCSLVWTMSGHDRAIALEHGAPRMRTHVVPNGVDLHRFQPMPESGGVPSVLFVGSFRHLPNLLAFEALREVIMPEVWRTCPAAVLKVVAGPDFERAVRMADKLHLLAPDPRIEVEGFVEDVRPAYREATVVAIPLPVSAGTNIKLMEAMACGRAVVSTPAGCRGLGLTSGHELMVAELDGGFAAAVIELLRDAVLRAWIAGEARKTAERRFGWDSIARDAMESYLALWGQRAGLHARSDAAD